MTLRMCDVVGENEKELIYSYGFTGWDISTDGELVALYDELHDGYSGVSLKICELFTWKARAMLSSSPLSDTGTGYYKPYAVSFNGELVICQIGDRIPELLGAEIGIERAVIGNDVSDSEESIAQTKGDRTLKVVDIVTGKIRTTLGDDYWVNTCVFSPDGKLIVSAHKDMTLKIWDVATGKVRTILKGHRGSVNTCAFSPDGRLVVSGGDDMTLKIWDVATGKERATLNGHTDWIASCAFSPCGTIIVSASGDMTLRIWKVDTEEEVAIFPALGQISWVDFDTESKICSADKGNNIYILHLVGIDRILGRK